ncbi:hypothetical protein PHYSODRAFT_328711 [Phytophthora sojae]|uniref:Uncharacterized protein n=1 Tax=Phytophthora sojae (strain P6497) TaxID=1094619 RepID=G4ZAY1_PHYSP|nr:hypothetical protein PHYSODRAFT_328711 [Phytophthora sojae]EGZ20609.1 hypothetical protein PHYSODRAFT_328711 [Phytophthora sojae]|eukprot:XP_009523326.1 hypothetical protein PHYSODRAFT_328711 [Phytophthora sojae]
MVDDSGGSADSDALIGSPTLRRGLDVQDGLAWAGSSGSDNSDSDSESSFDFDDQEEVLMEGADVATRRVFTVVGVFDSFTDARVTMVDEDDNVHAYETRYRTDRLLAHVYLCQSHDGCTHRFRIKSTLGDTVPATFHLEQPGEHGQIATGARRRGIHPTIREEVDALLNRVIFITCYFSTLRLLCLQPLSTCR